MHILAATMEFGSWQPDAFLEIWLYMHCTYLVLARTTLSKVVVDEVDQHKVAATRLCMRQIGKV